MAEGRGVKNKRMLYGSTKNVIEIVQTDSHKIQNI